ncbi:MAG: 50S ribosomal protein L20 [Candidatus Paceibacterota bacterium]|jgi:large subunit ribosomal protein L20
MTRIKRGTIAHKKREKLLKKVKGFRWGRKSKERAAKEALLHSQSRSFKGRKERKRDFRRIWQVRINAASRKQGISYSQFIKKLKDNKVELDRKILSEIAQKHPQVFEMIVKSLS